MKFQEVFSHLQVLHRVPVGSSIELARTTLNCFKGLEVLRLTSCFCEVVDFIAAVVEGVIDLIEINALSRLGSDGLHLSLGPGRSLAQMRMPMARPSGSDIKLCHIWMTEQGLARWLANVRADFLISHKPTYAAKVTADPDAIAKRARAIGIEV